MKKCFKSNIIKEYWETELHGRIPNFPVILYDKSIPTDFIFYDNVGYFYNEFIADQPDPNEVIIDAHGCIFGFKYHEKRFRYPVISNKLMTLDKFKDILSLSEIVGIELYLQQTSIADIMNLLKESQSIHKR